MDEAHSMKNLPEELVQILATTPPEEVIAKIEALDPPWKHDLLPWQVAQPGEPIPWQAVYSLIEQPVTPDDVEWARRKAIDLGVAEDA
jgi:hypothetical protein